MKIQEKILVFLLCFTPTFLIGGDSNGFKWDLPKHIAPPVVPIDNPMSNEKVELGRHLFYDKKLSGNQTQSCSSCHLQKFAFADHNPLGIGSTGEVGVRNPNSLTNTAYYTSYSWANPALGTLERFNILPIVNDNPVELGVHDEIQEKVLERFENNETYKKMFQKAFLEVKNPFTLEYIVKSISAFTRTLNSFHSPYDKYLSGDKKALTTSQKRGMKLFMSDRAKCSQCHSGIYFSNSTWDAKNMKFQRSFHNIGLYNLKNDGSYLDMNEGLFEVTQQNIDKGKFKAPSLRNVELTFPYMHDGSVATLKDVIELHSNGGRVINSGKYLGDGTKNQYKDKLIFAKKFTKKEKEDLENFLKSLTDNEFIKNPKIANPFGGE